MTTAWVICENDYPHAVYLGTEEGANAARERVIREALADAAHDRVSATRHGNAVLRSDAPGMSYYRVHEVPVILE